ncbi:hypothetical protein C8R47DRAFT_509559 [Mycena vitilis]|nr:hypothetical protein C8R47DRAFT_509559 [Mycena vitilis]
MSVSVCQVQVYRPYEHDAPGLLALNVPSKPVQGERKRTTSFSSPPRKRLHRTESYVDLSFAVCASTSTATGTASTSANATAVPYNRTLRFYKEQKERRRALLRRDPPALDAPSACAPSSSSSSSSPSPANSYTSLNPYTSPNSNASSAHAPNTALPLSRPSRPVPPRTHTRAKSTPPPPPAPTCARSIPPSPLCVSAGRVVCARTPPPAVRAPIPCRGPKPSAPPRSSVNTLSAYSSSCSSAIPSASASANGNANKPKKPSPSLHRRAVTACMRASPAGAKILHMGARLAVGIMSATRELERMCGPEGEASGYSSSLDPHEEEDEGEGMEDAEGEDVDPDPALVHQMEFPSDVPFPPLPSPPPRCRSSGAS